METIGFEGIFFFFSNISLDFTVRGSPKGETEKQGSRGLPKSAVFKQILLSLTPLGIRKQYTGRIL